MKLIRAFITKPIVLFLLIMAIGIFLRFYHFPQIPPGINQDEAGAGYEAYSLLLYGKDKWGFSFPMYFLSWGSGQNALQSYLQIPFIKFFGLTIFAVRLVPALLGALSIPLLYLFIKRIATTRSALLASFVLAVSPWGITTSRWSLESNLLPFFLLAGFCLLSYALFSPLKKWFISISLIPFALACYAYAVGIIFIPTIFILVFISYRKKIEKDIKLWLFSCFMFCIIIFPFCLFIYENNIIKYNLYSHIHLPVSITYFKVTRLTQILSDKNTIRHSIFLDNVQFLLSNFSDRLVWNMVPGFTPLFFLIPLFAIIKFFINVKKSIEKKSMDLVTIWLVSTLPLLFLFSLNINRSNAVFIPLIALFSTSVFSYMYEIHEKSIEKIFFYAVLVFVTWYSAAFCIAYFNEYPKTLTNSFNVGYEKALSIAIKRADGKTPVYITGKINLNYIVTLFYLRADPEDFRQHSIIHLDREYILVERYRNIYFQDDVITTKKETSYIYIVKKYEKDKCSNATSLFEDALWKVGECNL